MRRVVLVSICLSALLVAACAVIVAWPPCWGNDAAKLITVFDRQATIFKKGLEHERWSLSDAEADAIRSLEKNNQVARLEYFAVDEGRLSTRWSRRRDGAFLAVSSDVLMPGPYAWSEIKTDAALRAVQVGHPVLRQQPLGPAFYELGYPILDDGKVIGIFVVAAAMHSPDWLCRLKGALWGWNSKVQWAQLRGTWNRGPLKDDG
ncbi:MAG: hypothetical protein PHU21_02450 [Elusimicrobia bacterium]|nr:hypothetical protein [Elusimicrobiota bacterium]